jgi:hypothetical protein
VSGPTDFNPSSSLLRDPSDPTGESLRRRQDGRDTASMLYGDGRIACGGTGLVTRRYYPWGD